MHIFLLWYSVSKVINSLMDMLKCMQPLLHVTDQSLFFPSDDIMQRDNGPLCAAEIGSELQKQFAILPGWLL